MGRGRSSESMIGNTYGVKHGMHGTPEYRSWRGMLDRCRNSNIHNYMQYGGRGITVCDRWEKSFSAFFADMGPKPTLGHSIDRIDVNGNYEPGNCRWATRSEQQRNKRPFGSPVCRKGHILSEVGTYVTGNRGNRSCAQCAKDRARAYRERKLARP